MNFGIRRSVHFDDFDKWLLDLEGVPIELALPHDMEEFYPSIARLTDLADYVTDQGVCPDRSRATGQAFRHHLSLLGGTGHGLF